MSDVIATTPELRLPAGDDFWRDAKHDWSFCVKTVRRLWEFPATAIYWLQLTRTRKPNSWKIQIKREGIYHDVMFLDAQCPCCDDVLVDRYTGTRRLLERLVSKKTNRSGVFYVRLFYRED